MRRFLLLYAARVCPLCRAVCTTVVALARVHTNPRDTHVRTIRAPPVPRPLPSPPHVRGRCTHTNTRAPFWRTRTVPQSRAHAARALRKHSSGGCEVAYDVVHGRRRRTRTHGGGWMSAPSDTGARRSGSAVLPYDDEFSPPPLLTTTQTRVQPTLYTAIIGISYGPRNDYLVASFFLTPPPPTTAYTYAHASRIINAFSQIYTITRQPSYMNTHYTLHTYNRMENWLIQYIPAPNLTK